MGIKIEIDENTEYTEFEEAIETLKEEQRKKFADVAILGNMYFENRNGVLYNILRVIDKSTFNVYKISVLDKVAMPCSISFEELLKMKMISKEEYVNKAKEALNKILQRELGEFDF